MALKPLNDRVLIKRLDGEEKTAGGIIIPDNAKEKPMEGVVVATGEGKLLENGKVRPLEVKTGDTEAEIFQPEELEKLLRAAPARLIPILAIGGFSGLRAAELSRLDWSAVNLARRMIELRAGQAKTASRRIVPISDNLAALTGLVSR